MTERWYEAGNEAHFKPAPEGYVFQSPSPWMFTRPRYYLVNEAQKAELLAHLGRWRRLIVVGPAIALVFFMVLSTTTSFSPSALLALPSSSYLDGAIVALVVLIPTQIYLQRGLRTLLHDTSPTTGRIATQEQIAKAVSVKTFVIGMISAIGIIGMATFILTSGYFGSPPPDDMWFLIVMLYVIGGAGTIYYLYLWRLRSKSTA